MVTAISPADASNGKSRRRIRIRIPGTSPPPESGARIRRPNLVLNVPLFGLYQILGGWLGVTCALTLE
jgi:hypothetical protein